MYVFIVHECNLIKVKSEDFGNLKQTHHMVYNYYSGKDILIIEYSST